MRPPPRQLHTLPTPSHGRAARSGSADRPGSLRGDRAASPSSRLLYSTHGVELATAATQRRVRTAVPTLASTHPSPPRWRWRASARPAAEQRRGAPTERRGARPAPPADASRRGHIGGCLGGSQARLSPHWHCSNLARPSDRTTTKPLPSSTSLPVARTHATARASAVAKQPGGGQSRRLWISPPSRGGSPCHSYASDASLRDVQTEHQESHFRPRGRARAEGARASQFRHVCVT